MRQTRALHLLLLGLLTLSLAGCNLSAKFELARAQRAERQGDLAQAAKIYKSALAHLPLKENRLRSRAYLHLGECWLRLGNPSEAFSAFQKSVEADDSSVVAHLRLGEMYLAGGAAEKASEQASSVLELASTSTEGLALLGAASSAAGNSNLAQQAFETVLKSDPKQARVAVALADIYNQANEVEKAREVLQKATQADGKSSLPLLALGRLEEQEGNVAGAEEAYRKAVSVQDSVEANTRLATFLARTSRPDEALKILIHADSMNRELPVGRADFKLLSGDFKGALDEYTDVLNSPMFDTPGKKSWIESQSDTIGSSNEIRSRMAVRVIEADLQIAESVSDSDPLVVPTTGAAWLHFSQYKDELDPATSELLQAEISLTESDLLKASAHAQRALSVAPESAPAHYVYGLVLYRNGDTASGRLEWAKALNQDQSYVPARLALARDAVDTNDHARAEKLVIPVVRDEPENVRALKIFARSLIGQKRYPAAELVARRAETINPGDSDVHVLLGEIAISQQHLATALFEYEQALTLRPRSETAMHGLAGLYSRNRVTRPELAKLEKVAEAKPSSAPLMEIAGRLYAQNGWLTDAQRCLKRSIEIDPYRVTAINELAQFKAVTGDELSAINLGGRKGGAQGALLRGVQAETSADTRTALKEYESAIRQGETSGVAANNLAWLLASSGGDLNHALEAAQKAHSLAPESAAVLDTLGFVYLKRREFSAAIPVLTEASLLAQRKGRKAEEAAIRNHLEEAYLRSGQEPGSK